jgi:hypothetical protein
MIYIYLSAEVGSAALGHLEDDRSLSIAGSLEGGYDSRGGGDVDCRYGELVFLKNAESVIARLGREYSENAYLRIIEEPG